MPTPIVAPPRPPERGQSLVEFALMATILVVLLLGIVDMARAYFTYLAMRDAAQEGAYFGSVYPRCFDTTSAPTNRCANPNNMVYRTRQSAPSGGMVDWTDAVISHSKTDMVNPEAGDLVTVTIAYNYTLLTPFVGAIVGSQNLPLSAQSVAVIISDSLP